MWRYRDYVIRAFNQDRPYDRFIREQLAADAFPDYGDEGKIGLAFLHQWVPVERSEPQLSRRDFLNDVVGVTGSVFLGLTLETVSRQISALKRNGVISFSGTRRFSIPDMETLAAIAG